MGVSFCGDLGLIAHSGIYDSCVGTAVTELLVATALSGG